MANSFRAVVFSIAVFVLPLLLMDGAQGADPVEADAEASAKVSACAKCEGGKDAPSHCPVRTANAEEIAPAVPAPQQPPVPYCDYFDAASPVTGTPTEAPRIPKQGITQVMFNILVVQDSSDSFQEFVELKQTPLLMADAQMINGTLRILEKHRLIRSLANPRMVVVVGREGKFESSHLSSQEGEPWQGLRFTILANELRGGLSIDFELEQGLGEATNEVKTSLIVPTGQSVVLAAGPEAKDKSRVYVVLMPEIVKMPAERAAMIPPVRAAEK